VPTFKIPLKSTAYGFPELLTKDIVRALLLAPTLCNPCVGRSVTWVTNLASLGLVFLKISATTLPLPLKVQLSPV
jgi:hypothetical protein